MTAQQALALVRLAVVIAAIVVIYRNRCVQFNLLFSTPYLIWLGHAAIYLMAYLSFSFVGMVNAMFFNIWSGSIQLHGYTTVLVVEAMRYFRQRKQRGLLEC